MEKNTPTAEVYGRGPAKAGPRKLVPPGTPFGKVVTDSQGRRYQHTPRGLRRLRGV